MKIHYDIINPEINNFRSVYGIDPTLQYDVKEIYNV